MATLNFPDLNTKVFARPGVTKLETNSLSAIKEWLSQLGTHAFTNGVYIPEWNDYVRNDIMGIHWSNNYVGDEVHSTRDLMSKMINTFLLKDQVISHNLNMSDLILNAGTDGYQAIYNILVRHHPNLSTTNKVQTAHPAQSENESYASHVKHVQEYIAA